MQAGSDANNFLIDSNKFQGIENWAQIAQAKIHGVLPVRGAMIRASQGLVADTLLQRNALGATNAGVYRGFYHTVIPMGSTYTALGASAQAQATFFYQTVQAQQGWQGYCLNPGVDIEINPAGLSTIQYDYWLEQFLVALESLLGSRWPLKPMQYLSPSKWASLLGNTTTFSTYPLWCADWGVGQPADFGGWTEWLCWQWSSPGPLAGVPSQTDYDEWASSQFPAPIVPVVKSPSAVSSKSPLTIPSSPVPHDLFQLAQSLQQTAADLLTLSKDWSA